MKLMFGDPGDGAIVEPAWEGRDIDDSIDSRRNQSVQVSLELQQARKLY